jgi:predicted phage baseplate assembly protein
VLHASGLTWSPLPDLLNSGGRDLVFVAETEADGSTQLRFGDGEYGRAADPGDSYTADYRVGHGTAGNLPAGAIAGIDPPDNRITAVYQPLPAAGGVDPEAVELVKLLAPRAFRRPERAVTEADYAQMAQRFPGVQRATARLRWTGSWHTVFITVDRFGGAEVTPQFAADLRAFLERYRRAGHDLEVGAPVQVPLYLALSVCVRPEFLAEDVKGALLTALGSTAPGALFHPDNLTFGQPVYLSQVYRAALAVTGVASVQATAFNRWGRPAPATVPTVITPGPLEILTLADDPNFPERGKLDLTVAGGR